MPPPPLRVRWRGRKASGRTKDSFRSISAAPSRPARSCVRCSPNLATRRQTVSLEQLKIGQPDSVTLEGAGNFDRVNATGKLALNSSAASLGQLTSLIAPLCAGAGRAAQCDGDEPGPGAPETGARSRQECRAVRSRPGARRRSISTRRSSRASPRSPPSRPSRRSRASISPRSGAATSRLSPSCRPSKAAPCWRCSASIARSRPAKARRNSRARRRAHGARRCGSRQRSRGPGLMPTRKAPPNHGRQEAKASFILKVRSADLGPLLDLKPADTLAQNIGLSSRVSLAGNRLTFDDLDSSIAGSRLRGRLAVTLGEEKKHRGRNRRRPARAGAGLCAGARRRRTRCRRAARRRAGEGLARQDRVPGAARPAAGRQRIAAGERRRQERRPVADLRCHQGQDRRRRSHRQYRCQAGRERHCVERERPVLRRRRHGAALSQSRDARRPRVDADDADKPGPQRLGAGRRAVRQRNGDAGSGADLRPRSARLRGGGPRQRQRAGKGRRRG